MALSDLPLLDLFIRLHEADLPLGIDDYYLMLRALQGGFGIADKDALIRLCRTLWVKSADDSYIFDYHFEQVMTTFLASKATDETLPIPADSSQKFETRPTSTRLPQRTDIPTSYPTETPEPLLKVEDDVRVAQVISQGATNDESAYNQFIQTDEYLPVTRRQMKQSWRHFRRAVREGPPTELDIDSTIKSIGRQGFFLDAVLVPHHVNRAKLLLLIDQGGSMIPFHILSRRLGETAMRGGRLGRAGTYYFHNCPVDYLYHDPAHHKAESIQGILSIPYSEQTGILIFSDGGAARGTFNWERVELTKEFLRQFRQQFRRIAWLNPVPHKRWPGTTAGEIMHLVPMFDVSHSGLDNAISVLRGRSSRFTHIPRYIFNE